MDYQKLANLLKVVAEPNRLKILEMLSCGEMCACNILDHFDFTQPTLSHHMKMLEEKGLVTVKKSQMALLFFKSRQSKAYYQWFNQYTIQY